MGLRTSTTEQQNSPLQLSNIDSLKNNWTILLNLLAPKIGNGTTSLLSRAVPTRFENDILTITFDASASLQKKMCESNGRTKQIKNILSDYFQKALSINLELGTTDSSPAGRAAAQTLLSRQKENEIVNHPAVKTIITELGAAITGIEELNNNS